MLTLIMKSVWTCLCHEPQTSVILRPLQQDRHHEAHYAAAARWHEKTDRQAGKLKQTGKQTDKQGRGNAPESNDTSQCLHTHPDWARREAGREGGMRLSNDWSVDTQHPAHLKHTACNDWRHGCLPLGINTSERGGRGGSTVQMQKHNTTSSSNKP